MSVQSKSLALERISREGRARVIEINKRRIQTRNASSKTPRIGELRELHVAWEGRYRNERTQSLLQQGVPLVALNLLVMMDPIGLLRRMPEAWGTLVEH